MGRLPAIELVLLWVASVALADGRTVCVPGEDRRWICGDPASLQGRPIKPPDPPPAAPLPPVLLIDPDRLFGPAPARSDPAATPSVPPASTRIAAPQPTAARTAPARPEPAPAPVTPTSPQRGRHVWQLARAGNPAGFAALLRQRGIDPADTQSLQTRRGDWLLLYGDFATIDAARAARSKAGAGFARAWRDVQSEL